MASGGKGKGRGRGRGRAADTGADAHRPGLANRGRNSDFGSTAAAKPGADTVPSKKTLADTLRAFSTPQWWSIGGGLHSKPEEKPAPRGKQRGKPEAFQQQCVEKHAEIVKLYESAMKEDSEQRWLRKVCSEGTMGDRVASLTMLIQVCPVLSTSYIKALLTMASKFGRSDQAMAVDALKDLFMGTLLPDRKLKTLAQMEPLTEKFLGKSVFIERCVVAFFEDFLKTSFAAFVQVLGEAAHSSVVFLKMKAIRTAADLLAAKPEQERALLGLLVNKFGDLAPKVSSLVSFCLQKVQEAHPGMKSIVTKEVESFLMRPNVSRKSEYHAMLHLSEIVLAKKEEDSKLAAQLVRLYVLRLEQALRPSKPTKVNHKFRRKKQQRIKRRRGHLVEDDNRLVRTLINGIQRALPYFEAGLVTGSPVEKDTIDALFKVCHTVSAFSTRIAILSLLFRCLVARGGDLPDRFYRLLYEQVVQFDFWGSTHRQKALLLLRRCVPADTSLGRGVAVGRRLLQVGANAEPAVAAAGLSVMRELLLAHRAEMKQLLGTSDKQVTPPGDAKDDEEAFVDDDVANETRHIGSNDDGALIEACFRYSPLAREPQHARARHTPIWELHALARHVHPFVAHGATRLLAHEGFDDAGSNPFEDLSVNDLLEQFAYVSRAKGKAKPNGASAGAGSKDRTVADKAVYNSESFARKKNVLPHERFFQMYFRDSVVRNQQHRKAKLRRQQGDDMDEETIGTGAGDANAAADDEEDADRFFDEYLEGQIPKADEDDDGDDDGGDSIDSEFDEDDDEDPEIDSGSCQDSAAEDEDAQDAEESEGRKRKADKAALPTTHKERVKALKKKHSGSMFASAEDFEQLIAEDS